MITQYKAEYIHLNQYLLHDWKYRVVETMTNGCKSTKEKEETILL